MIAIDQIVSQVDCNRFQSCLEREFESSYTVHTLWKHNRPITFHQTIEIVLHKPVGGTDVTVRRSRCDKIRKEFHDNRAGQINIACRNILHVNTR